MNTLSAILRRQRYLAQPILCQMQFSIIFVGAMFWIEARIDGEAFSADVFGEFALRFPAELWAFMIMGASALCWIGLRDPLKRWMVAVGAGLQAVQYLALGYSAIVTGGEMVVGLHCTTFFAPMYLIMFWEAVRRDTH
jgi:hypothetical protein